MDAALELRVHLAGGSVHRFAQADPDRAQGILNAIEPYSFFQGSQLTFAGENGVSLFRPAQILRLDMVCENPPVWPTPPGYQRFNVISETELHRGLASVRSGQPPGEGEEFVGYGTFEFIDGQRFHVEARGRVGEEPFRAHNITHVLFFHTLHAYLVEGGLTLVNLANVSGVLTYRALVEFPAEAWEAMRVAE